MEFMYIQYLQMHIAIQAFPYYRIDFKFLQICNSTHSLIVDKILIQRILETNYQIHHN